MKVFQDKLLRLANWLVVLMSVLIVVSMMILVQLTKQNENDGTLNTSGRQRYLSQKLTKTSILLFNGKDSIEKSGYAKAIETDLKQYKSNNRVLLSETD